MNPNYLEDGGIDLFHALVFKVRNFKHDEVCNKIFIKIYYVCIYRKYHKKLGCIGYFTNKKKFISKICYGNS